MEADCGQGRRRDEDLLNTLTRNDCAAKTVAPKRGGQKLPEGKVEIPPK